MQEPVTTTIVAMLASEVIKGSERPLLVVIQMCVQYPIIFGLARVYLFLSLKNHGARDRAREREKDGRNRGIFIDMDI